MKRFPKFADKYLKKGPTAPFLDGIKRYRVTYRTRERGRWQDWDHRAIEMTVRSEQDARYRVVQQCRDRVEVDIVKVEEVAAEAPIQTGQSVQTIPQKEYDDLVQNKEEEIKERLRKDGMWLPDA